MLARDGKETINKQYDFVVLDELHRTGAKEWGDRLNTLLDNQPESTKVLGITATPRRDADGINMANEVAQRLGYTNREAVSGKHVAMNISLTNAIRMGLVVNPKLVSCAYSLKTDGSLDKLKGKIDQIEDVQDRNEKLEEYESLRRNVENAEGILEILQANVKKGGKYIVFLPIVDELEDEDGNVIGRKKGKDKIADYEKQIAEYFKGSNIVPNFHSMLGEYGDKENARRLEEFQNSNSEETEFMLVMNKANEGLHLDKLDGMIWLRPMDENSRILYLQQLGRVIYSEDPDNSTKDENRPVVIDLVNNTLKVNWENEITEQDDIQMLNLILDWTERHDGTLPDINSSDKEETGYATVLKEIQNKYKEYLKNEFEGLNEKQIEEVKEIIRIGSQIDLWQIELPNRITKSGGTQIRGFTDKNAGPFELTGLLRDFVELEDEVDAKDNRTAVERFIQEVRKLYEIGVDVSKMSRRDTMQTLANKSEISIELLRKIGVNPDDNIGIRRSNISRAYRGGRGIPPTKEQVEELRNLGVDLEVERKNITEEFIEELIQLQDIGINISKIITTDTIETLAKKSNIDLKILKDKGIDLDKKIGLKKHYIIGAYRGNNQGMPPTPEQVEILSSMGIRLELQRKSAIESFIEDLEKLQSIGVDVSALSAKDTIMSLADKSGISIAKIEEVGLNPDKQIGNIKYNMSQLYRGGEKVRGIKPTEEQKSKLEAMRISLELQMKDNATEGFIKKIEKLQSIGVDVSKITTMDSIESLARKSGVEKKVIEGIELNPDEKIGKSKSRMIESMKSNRNRMIPPTEEQLLRLEELGIKIDFEKKSATQIFIENLECLKDIGVDTSKITAKDTIETLAIKSNISIEKIEKIGLNPKEKIGYKKTDIIKAYRGKGRKKLTEEQISRLLKLGISLEPKSRTSKEIAEASISSLTDIEMSDREDAALKELVERTKEGGMNLDEQS